MVLLRYLKVPKDVLLDPRGSLANEVQSCVIQQANQCWLPFTNEMMPIYIGNGGNCKYNSPPFTNMLN